MHFLTYYELLDYDYINMLIVRLLSQSSHYLYNNLTFLLLVLYVKFTLFFSHLNLNIHSDIFPNTLLSLLSKLKYEYLAKMINVLADLVKH